MIDWNLWAAIIGFGSLGLAIVGVCVWLIIKSEPPHGQ